MFRRLMIMMGMACAMNANAVTSVMDIAQEGEDTAALIENMENEAIGAYFDTLIACELEVICVADKLEAMKKTTTNVIMVFMIDEILKESEEQIKWHREHPNDCKIDELTIVRKNLTKCMPILKQAIIEEDEELGGDWAMCVFRGMQPLAEDRNLFAVAVLADFFDAAGVEEMAERYKRVIEFETKKEHPHAKLLEHCVAWD